MMRGKLSWAWMFIILVAGTSLARGQETIPSKDSIPGQEGEMAGESYSVMDSLQLQFSMEGELPLRTEENLDSLLNLWFVEQAADAVDGSPDEYDPSLDTIRPEFPDSVYMARLAEIPSVVDLTYNKIVRNFIHVYTQKRREQVRSMLGMSQYYFPLFEEIFDLYQVPYEIKYLSVVESALNPRAVSRAGAVGAWQFMYSTGRSYGLEINSLVDERRDPVAATHAAARYLANMYKMYGDWTLALAAYNCGPGNVNKAIRRSGGRRSFWEIYYYLPRETRGYVPAYIAATYVMNYYPEHLISPGPVVMPAHTDTLEIFESLHLQQVAEVLDIPLKLLRDLNPQYRADIIPARTGKSYALRVPGQEVGAFIDLQDSIFAYKDSVFFDKGNITASPQHYSASYRADLPSDKYDKLYYTVKAGDNVGYIADWYDVRASDLRYWNNINRNIIRTGQKLVIYKPKGRSAPYANVNDMTFAQKQAFAGRTSGSGSASSAPVSGSAAASPGPVDNSGYVTYTVRSGDSLWEIARRYPGVSENDIARLNNITNASKIRPGQVIRIKPQ